jgi:penicillin-binding protein 1A
VWAWLVAAALWLGLAAVALGVVLAWDLPRPETALASPRQAGLVLLARDGAPAGRIGEHYGETLRPAELPRHLVDAVLATEDRRFFAHGGLDLRGILRAAWVNAQAGAVVEGGSTITQQVAKTLFLSNARTWRRKGQEALLALWLEQHFGKDEILGIWLNRVYLGGGAYGVDAAARLYFGVPARRATLFQAAVLAGLPKAPSRLNPHADADAAIARAREVLGNMVEAGRLDAATAARTIDAGRRAGFRAAPPGGAFASFAAEEAAASAATPAAADLVVATTLDAALQARAHAALAAALARHPAVEGAVVVIDAGTGAIRAMVGGVDASAFNRAAHARRPAGSAFKPVMWLAALRHGAAPGDMLDDRPITLGAWNPRNFNDQYAGRITLAEALARSSNSIAVQLFQRVGPRRVGETARLLGLPAPVADATAALGTGSVTPLSLAAAYAPFANGGLAVMPHAVARIAERQGRVLWRRAAAAPRRVITEDEAAAMAAMLRGAVATGTGRAAAIAGVAVAGKTGTTSESRDAWFAGFAGGLVVVVWMGADDNAPMGPITGGGLPAQVFRAVLAASPSP